MNMGTIRNIMQILDNAYGSNQMASVDRAAAIAVISYFEDKGYLGPEELAFMVEAAGGEVRISETMLSGTSKPLLRYYDEMNMEYVFKTVDKISEPVPDVSKAKVNPDAESRTVDSGPIKVKPVRGAEEHVIPNPGPYS